MSSGIRRDFSDYQHELFDVSVSLIAQRKTDSPGTIFPVSMTRQRGGDVMENQQAAEDDAACACAGSCATYPEW